MNNIVNSNRFSHIQKIVSAFASKLSHIILLANDIQAEVHAVASNHQLGRPIQWPEIIVAFCLASALQIATVQSQLQSKLAPNMVVVSVAILVSFTSIFVSKYIASKFPGPALVLEHFGVLFTVTAFFAAITVSLSKPLVVLAWLVYAISFVAIVVCNCFF